MEYYKNIKQNMGVGKELSVPIHNVLLRVKPM